MDISSLIENILSHVQAVWYLYVLGGVAFGALCWLHSTFIKLGQIYKITSALSDQFKNNGGGSIKDILDEILRRVDGIEFMRLAHLNIIDLPVFIADKDGKYKWVNRAYLEMVDMTFDEVIGSGWISSIIESDRIRVQADWNSACAEIRPYTSVYKIKVGDKIFDVKCQATGKKGLGYFGCVMEYKKIRQIE